MARILVVDDESGIRELFAEVLRDEGHEVLLADGATAARDIRNTVRPDLVFLDIWMAECDGVTLLKEWGAMGQLDMPVIMISGHGTIDTAVEATQLGALDFLEKPVSMKKLLSAVERALALKRPLIASRLSLAAFKNSAQLRELCKKLERLIQRHKIIMLRSPAGSIAELATRTVHNPLKPWVDLALSYKPITLEQMREIAGGTIYCGELASLGHMQRRNLIFALEHLDNFSLRIVVASKSRPEELALSGWDWEILKRFFDVWLVLPTLAQLSDDIPEIATQVLLNLIENGEVPMRRLSTDAINALRAYSWPAGESELWGVIKSIALSANDEVITSADLQSFLQPKISTADHPVEEIPRTVLELPIREARDRFERAYFEFHLQREGGNMGRLAERVGMERTHLYRRVKSLGIRREDFASFKAGLEGSGITEPTPSAVDPSLAQARSIDSIKPEP